MERRWSTKDFDKLAGVVWEPYLGAKGGFELRSKTRLPTKTEKFTRSEKGKDDYAPTRMRIRNEDFEKGGYTAGRPGCRAAN